MRYLLLLLLFLSPFVQACTEPPPLRLTSTQREQVDTMYLQQVTRLSDHMDSLCIDYKARNLQRTVDSILRIRKVEEEALRKKYQNRK